MTKRYKHLTIEDRTLIQTQLQLGFRPAAIAAGLNRPRSCVTREMARNGWTATVAVRPVGRPALAGGYWASRANKRAVRLAAIPRVERKLVYGNALWERVTPRERQGLSPEQIAGILRRMNEPVRLSHETIYQAIYVTGHPAYRDDRFFAFWP